MHQLSSPVPVIDSINIHENGYIVLTLKEFIPKEYFVLLTYDSESGTNFGLGNPVETERGTKDIVINLNMMTANRSKVIAYRFRVLDISTGIIIDTDIQNPELDEIIQSRVFLVTESSIISNLTSLTGSTSPDTSITVSVPRFDGMFVVAQGTSSHSGTFDIALPYPTLGKRLYKISATGKYGETANTFVSVNPASPEENLLYNPTFSNNAELWETRGAYQSIQSGDDYTTFTLTGDGSHYHLGAVQSLELGSEQFYTMSLDVRVTALYDPDPDKILILGDVIPGGGMAPGSQIYQAGVDFPLNTWVRLHADITDAYSVGFTTKGVVQLEVQNSSLLPATGKHENHPQKTSQRFAGYKEIPSAPKG